MELFFCCSTVVCLHLHVIALLCVFGNGMEMGMPMGMGIDCMEENGNAKNPVPVISTLNATADSDA